MTVELDRANRLGACGARALEAAAAALAALASDRARLRLSLAKAEARGDALAAALQEEAVRAARSLFPPSLSLTLPLPSSLPLSCSPQRR